MKQEYVFLLEESSMEEFLKIIIPKWWPHIKIKLIPHEGKKDLEKSIPRKLRAWNNPKARFIIIQDNDGGDCLTLKARLKDLCKQAGQPEALVRIVCQELEAWYLGDGLAISKAFNKPKLAQINRKTKYRSPDEIPKPSIEMERLVPGFKKTSGARMIANHLSRENTKSRSFLAFIRGMERLINP